MEETGFSRCQKLMVFFNILFLLCGIALLVLGIWVIVDFSSFSATLTSSSLIYQHASYISIVVGGITVLLSLCGCVGALKENKCLLTMFVTVMVCFLLVEIAGLVLIAVFISGSDKILSEAALHSIKTQYGVKSTTGSGVTIAWDFAQSTLGCCGYNNGTDYFGSLYDISSPFQLWPLSCCRINSVGGYVDGNQCLMSSTVSAENSNAMIGCFSQLRHLTLMYTAVIGGAIGGSMLVQFLAVVFACCVASHIGKSGKVQAWS